MRTLAVDFGERRVGLAISDAEGRMALPLATLGRRDDASLIRQIADLVREHEVAALVVGEPLNVDGSRGPAAERVRRFAAKLGEATGLPLRLVPETLTTVEAANRLAAAGIDPRKAGAGLDAVAAQVLLEEALAGGATATPPRGREEG